MPSDGNEYIPLYASVLQVEQKIDVIRYNFDTNILMRVSDQDLANTNLKPNMIIKFMP